MKKLKNIITFKNFLSFLLFNIFIVIWIFSLSACANNSSNTEQKAKEITNQLSLEEKVGQLFIIRPEALVSQYTTAEIENIEDNAGIKEANQELIDNMKNHNLSGFAMFAKNITNPEQITNMIDKLQENSKYGLFMGIDEEGGRVARIANNNQFNENNVDGGMQKIGLTGDVNKAYEATENISRYLTKYKFNLDFAPVCDVNTNPSENSLKDRSFGSDPELVANMVEQAIKGLHKNNVMTTMKHFPGSGDATGDTHKNSVIVNKTWDEMEKCEMIPFKRAIENETDFAMVGHEECPNVTGNDYPASLSKEIITNKLKNELGFKGIVITDALAMEAVNSLYPSDQAAVQALKAGVDILLMPKEFQKAYDGVINAVNTNQISEDELNEHVTRVINIKIKHGLIS